MRIASGQQRCGIVKLKLDHWHRGKGGGGAIDLVMHVKNLCFHDALDWLGRQFAGVALSVSTPPIPSSVSPLQLPPPHPGNLLRVRPYLTEQRRIAPATIDLLIAFGALKATLS